MECLLFGAIGSGGRQVEEFRWYLRSLCQQDEFDMDVQEDVYHKQEWDEVSSVDKQTFMRVRRQRNGAALAFIEGSAEPQRVDGCNIRSTQCLPFSDSLLKGFKLLHSFQRKGYLYVYEDLCTIQMLQTEEFWLVEVASKPVTFKLVDQTEQRMLRFAQQIKGRIELKSVSHNALQQRIHSSLT